MADSAVVHETNVHGRKCWRLGAMDEFGNVEHEISFRMQGILSKVDLVPGNITRCSLERAANLCQRVELTGIGSESFALSANNILVVQDIFRRFFAGQRTDGRAVEEVPFGPGVDPLGHLANFRSSDLVHTAENDVKYFRLANDLDKRHALSDRDSFYEAFPAAFRKGDIVEVQGSIIAFFAKNHVVKTIFQMNVLTLLDASFSKAAEVAKSHAYKPAPPRQLLKRKVWYEQEDSDVHITRRRFKDLRLEETVAQDHPMGEDAATK
ncbi:hypothetical protein R3P38DRAFT_3171588 [Favolaschia claudopus]|uniref:Uncharacterized protein n=1 Tax=Favolaschia claudopus TaxID=2862362 RepID=A0AAW0DST5_9AGAR